MTKRTKQERLLPDHFESFEPMPAFQDLPEPIRIAWQAAVRQVGDIFECPRTAFGNEQAWASRTPPSV